MKEKILTMLKNTEDEFISGQHISDLLGITRAGIWKYMNALKEDGYVIEAVSRKGYKLISSPDILTPDEVIGKLTTEFIGRNIIHFDSIDSTNVRAKKLAALGEIEGTVVVSEEQVAGKGRLGKSWFSPKGKCIFFSIILRPDIDPIHAAKITLVGAAAVFEAIAELGLPVTIKWPNDILVDKKKVCGILTEMSAEINNIHYLVIGIGVNTNLDEEDFSDEVKNVATSLKIQAGKMIDRKSLLASMLNHFEVYYTDFINTKSIARSIEVCKKNSLFIGNEVRIIRSGNEVIVKAIDINEDGNLVVEHKDGTIENVISGEVSMRGLLGYA